MQAEQQRGQQRRERGRTAFRADSSACTRIGVPCVIICVLNAIGCCLARSFNYNYCYSFDNYYYNIFCLDGKTGCDCW